MYLERGQYFNVELKYRMKNSHFEKIITENLENLAISSPPVTFLKYILKAPTFLNFLAKYSPCLDPGLPGPGVGGGGGGGGGPSIIFEKLQCSRTRYKN